MDGLVAPIIPNGNDSKGPELFLQGLGQGLAAFARLAEMRRKSESDMAELAMKERISQEAHDLELKKIEAQVPLIDAHRKYYDSLIDLNTAKTNAYADGTATAAQRLIKRQELERQLQQEVNDSASELKLDDPVFATKEPIQYGANFLKFKGQWQQSPLPWVHQTIRNYEATADQTKIPIRFGAVLKEGEPPGDPQSYLGGKTVPRAAWQIARDLQNPDTREMTMNALRASGHIQTESYQVPGDPESLPPWKRAINWGENFIGVGPQFAPSPQTKMRDKPDALTGKIIEGSKSTPLELGTSRVPPSAPKSNAYETISPQLTEPDLPPGEDQPLPDPQSSATPTFDPTQTDLYIQHAKNAIAQGAPLSAVAQRLSENFGIDPAGLFAT